MQITDNVYQLDTSRFSHVFLIKDDESMLIDTGMPGGAGRILEEVRSLGVAPESIRTILLTHHDVDHMGNAKRLQEATGASLWAPQADIPYITGEKNRPGIKHVVQVIARPQKPDIAGMITTDRRFGEVRAIHAPGHTPGHTVFQYRNVVFVGDLFRFMNGKFGQSSKNMTWDGEKAAQSISLLKRFEFDWLCPAHGGPVRNGPAVKDFLSRY